MKTKNAKRTVSNVAKKAVKTVKTVLSEGNKRLITLTAKLNNNRKKPVENKLKVKNRKLGAATTIDDISSFNEVFVFGLLRLNKPSTVAEVVDALIATKSPFIKQIAADKTRFTQQMYNVASSLARTHKIKREPVAEGRGFVYGLNTMFESKKPAKKVKRKVTPKKVNKAPVKAAVKKSNKAKSKKKLVAA